MFQIAICDDEPLLLAEMESHIQHHLEALRCCAVTTTFTSGQALLYEIEDNAHFDLFFLDIEMPDLDGMELAKLIHQSTPGALVIFVTAHYQYAIDSYALNIFRYLPKNQLRERLPHALRDALKMLELQYMDSYVYTSGNRLERIPFRDILYIGKDGKNAVFHRKSMPDLRMRKSLSTVYEELAGEDVPPGDFLFIDRSYIVNLSHITSIDGTTATLTDGTTLPIAHSRLADLKKQLIRFWGDRL